MNLTEATAIANDLPRVMNPPSTDNIQTALAALARLDAQQCEDQAIQALAEIETQQLGLGGDELAHRIEMDVWTSVWDVLEAKTSEIDTGVEHDIATWIEGNAPILAAANLQLLIKAASDNPEARQALSHFQDSDDFAACEQTQTRALMQAWKRIEDRIRDRLRAGA